MKSGFKIGSVIGLVGLIATLAFFAYTYRNEKIELEWLLFAKQAEVDTLKVIAEYSVPETVLVSRIRIIHDTTEGQITVDTVYESVPKIYGSIKIDTTRDFGPGSNPMKVRVVAELWYPEEYFHRNWLLIHPVMGKKTPYLPSERSQTGKWGIGIMAAFNSNSELMGLAEVRRNRFSVYGGYSIPGKYYLMGMGLRLIEW